MKGHVLAKALTLAAILSLPAFSAPGAEEILHYGTPISSEESGIGCVSCHDGLTASEIKLTAKIGNIYCGHPVGRDYPPAGKPEAYLTVEMVTAAGIKLLNGQVSCISCHNLKNPESPHLAVPLDKSSLCFACHKI